MGKEKIFARLRRAYADDPQVIRLAVALGGVFVFGVVLLLGTF